MLVLGKDKLFIYLPLFDFNNESFEKSIENSNIQYDAKNSYDLLLFKSNWFCSKTCMLNDNALFLQLL